MILRSQLSTLRWRTRLTLWIGAAVAGLLVVAFAKLADLGLAAFYALWRGSSLAPFPADAKRWDGGGLAHPALFRGGPRAAVSPR